MESNHEINTNHLVAYLALNPSTNRLPCGHPHFSGVYRQNKHSDYDLKKAICEFVDNPLKKANTIMITTIVTDSKISEMKISDDYPNGFENMFEEGISNPFNMTHIRPGQYDDNETSQFGVGLKAGAISTGDKMDVYTKVNGKTYQVEMDFQAMCEREEDSFSPNYFDIPTQIYASKHPFEKGSTIILTRINSSIYKNTDLKSLTKYIKKELASVYNDYIKEGKKIIVNGELIEEIPDIFENKDCKCFTNCFTIYTYKNEYGEDTYYITNGKEYYEYDDESKSKRAKKEKDGNRKYVGIEKTKIGEIKSTFTFFKEEEDCPFGVTNIYRDGRLYGSWRKKQGANKDGNKNYNISRIDITNKELALKLGLTFNKNIAEGLINTETNAFDYFIKVLYEGLNANRSTSAYTKLFEIAKLHNLNTVGKEPTEKEKKVPEPPVRPTAPSPTVPSVTRPDPPAMSPPEVTQPEPPSVTQPVPPAISRPAVTQPEPASVTQPVPAMSRPAVTQPEPPSVTQPDPAAMSQPDPAAMTQPDPAAEPNSVQVKGHYKTSIPPEKFNEFAQYILQNQEELRKTEMGIKMFNLWYQNN